MLAGSQINESDLDTENAKISVLQVEQLLCNIVDHSRPGLVMDYGTQLNLSAFGIVGYAALSSPTGRDALRIANQYIPIVSPLLDIQIIDGPELTEIQLELTYPLKESAGRAMFEVALASLYTMASFVLLDKLPKIRLEVNYPLAPYHNAFTKDKNIEIYGDCPCTRIFIPTEVLNYPFPLANHLSFNMSVKQCDELMEQLPAMDRSLSTGIQRRLLLPQGERPLTQEDVASELFMSVRTLHRLLQREQTSFREIVNETLTLRAKLLMDQNQLNITQIAQELGYSDAANFTRAFRNQTGTTPSEYRKSQEG